MRTATIFLLAMYWVGITWAQSTEVFSSDLQTEKKPWTHLDFEDDPNQFQFAIVTDRTGGPRPGIFEDAIKKLNWLHPEFVISVGDLIRGAQGKDSAKLAAQWSDHFERIEPLTMPFFHLAGNHDIKANSTFQVDYWNRMFGTPYYSFRYKDVLFLCMFSNEGFQVISEEQIAYFKQVLADNEDVRWTMVFLHHPLWIYPHATGFGAVEDLIADRRYSVFAGHHHQYHYYNRKGQNYYVLATTGGGSGLLGNSFGQFDHVTWVTMTDEGPELANLRLDGILPHDIANNETAALSAALINSVRFDTDVFVDDPKAFQSGVVKLTYTNDSDRPLYLRGRFYHHHQIHPSPSELDVELPPQSIKTVSIDLATTEPLDLKEDMRLDLEGSIGYDHPDYTDLRLSGVSAIELVPSQYNVLPTEEAEFLGAYTLELDPPLAGTQIHYTLDGSEPSLTSPIYRDPLVLQKASTVKANLFTPDGMHSKTDVLKVKPIKPGKGVICAYYEQDRRKQDWYRVPDFSQLTPTTIKATTSLDPKKAGKRQQFFGAVYKGKIDLPESGTYTWSAISDEGIIIYLNGKAVVVDAVKHKEREATGTIDLEQGINSFEMHYYQRKKNLRADVFYTTPSGKKVHLQGSMMTYGEVR